MISVFVHSPAPNDFPNWRWQVGADMEVPADTLPKLLANKTAVYERRSPIPSIILPNDTRAVAAFKDSLPNTEDVTPDHVTGMKKFISDLREIIGQCESVAVFKNDPLCVFIHFGGEALGQVAKCLGEVWKRLDEKDKETFLCFAITRRGVGINGAWQREDGTLVLPSDEQGVLDVLEEGCKGLGNPYQEYYTHFENTTPKIPDTTDPKREHAERISQPQPDNKNKEPSSEPPSDVLILADGKLEDDSRFSFWSARVKKGGKWEGVDVKSYDEVLGEKADAGSLSSYVFIILDYAGDIDLKTLRKLPPRTLRIDGNKYQARVDNVERSSLVLAKTANEFKVCVYRSWLNCLEDKRRVEEPKREEPKRDVSKNIVLLLLKAVVLLELVAGFALSCWKCWRSQSLKSELGFGVLGLVFLVVTVVVLLASRDDEPSKG